MLAWIQNEPAAPMVDQFFRNADDGNVQLLMSWINAGEAYYVLAKTKSPSVAEAFLKHLAALPVRLLLPDESDVISAARLKGSRRLSYADVFAAALAIRESAAVITGDPELRDCSDILGLEWIGA